MRRALPLLAGAVIVVGGLAGLVALFSGRDDAGLSTAGAVAGPGALEPDRGAAHAETARVGERADVPPTSGEHAPRNPVSEARVDDAALLHALEAGDVVIAYPGRRPAAGLLQLRRDLTGPFDAELAAAGQMVLLVHRAGLDRIQALAWRRRLEATGPEDPRLRAFAEAWLGKGAGQTA